MKRILQVLLKLLFYLLVVLFLFIAAIPLMAHGRFALTDAIDQGWAAFWVAATIWLFILRFFAGKFLTGRKQK